MIILLLQSCLVQYGTQTQSSFTSTNSNDYKNKSGKVDLFFEGTKISYEYETVGFVEATGSETSTTEELLNFLKYKAYQNGADAIINVKKESVIRKTGYLFDDEYDEIYSAPSFNGIAVKYTNQVELIKNVPDTSFVRYVKEVNKMDSAKIEKGIIWSLLLGVITVIAVIIKGN